MGRGVLLGAATEGFSAGHDLTRCHSREPMAIPCPGDTFALAHPLCSCIKSFSTFIGAEMWYARLLCHLLHQHYLEYCVQSLCHSPVRRAVHTLTSELTAWGHTGRGSLTPAPVRGHPTQAPAPPHTDSSVKNSAPGNFLGATCTRGLLTSYRLFLDLHLKIDSVILLNT